MPIQKKKDKKNGIEKLRIVLDDHSFKDLNPEDEKYLKALKERLDESSEEKNIFKKITYGSEESSEEELLKPRVVIHERVEKKIVEFHESKEVKEKDETIEKESHFKDEELIDIKKVKPSIPEFIEVKPEKVKKDKKIEAEKTEERIEVELTETKEPVEFVKVESEKAEPEKMEEISEWQPIDSGEYIPKEKQDETIIQPVEETEVVKEDMKPDETDKIIEVFKDIQSINKETAILLYNNGYTNIDMLNIATAKELAKIKGIKRKTAKQIKKELEQKQEPKEVEWKPIQETVEEKIEEKRELISVNETNYCRNCGSVVGVGTIFCAECGTKLIDEEETLEKPAEITKIEVGETAEKEVTVEEIEKIDEEIPLEEKIEPFKDLESVNENTAVLLYDNGYTSFDSLKNVDVKDLKNIKGIKRKIAKQIRQEVDKKIIEAAKVKPISIGESSEGIVTKDQLEKEEKFEEEKQPVHPVELSNNKEWEAIDEDIKISDDKKIEENLEKELEEKIEIETKESVDSEETPEKAMGEQEKDLEKKIETFKDISSIDEKTAVLLYDVGFTTLNLLKDADFKDLKKIKGLKRKKVKEIIKDVEELCAEAEAEITLLEEDEEFFEEESKKLDKNIKDFEGEEETILDGELFIEEEPTEKISDTKIEDEIKREKNDDFRVISSIDGRIKDLLNEHNIITLQDLDETTIKELAKIKGIRRKVAKQIKKELKEYLDNAETDEEIPSIEENPYINDDDFSEEDEWETFEETPKKEKKSSKKGFMYGDYSLYEKEITTKNSKKRLVRFFSKGEPDDAKPIDLPEGYEINENKKTGVPYLKKEK